MAALGPKGLLLSLSAMVMLSAPQLSGADLLLGGGVLRLRGGASMVASRPMAPGLKPTLLMQDDNEILDIHKANLRARSQVAQARPVLLDDSRSAAHAEQPRMLSLVKPNTDGGALTSGVQKELEDAKKFTAFQGTGHLILEPDTVKKSSASQMHRLALARLSRLQDKMTVVMKQEDSETEEGQSIEQAQDEQAEKQIEEHLRRSTSNGIKKMKQQEPLLASQEIPYVDANGVVPEEGTKEDADEFGNSWKEVWGRTDKGKFGTKQGWKTDGSTWNEEWAETMDGEFELKGWNSEGHMWGEKAGAYGNGTRWHEKYLMKPLEGFHEITGWNSEGQTSGSRSGCSKGGTPWNETWVQVIDDYGVTTGFLTGTNAEGGMWEEEWESQPLNSFDADTGKQEQSHCGQKSGVSKSGAIWSEAWGHDDIHGRWGSRTEELADGSRWSEQWGENKEGDIWCSKAGTTVCEKGNFEEWAVHCGQKNVRIGQEMDGEVNYEEGKIQTWKETWTKTFEEDGRLAGTHAEKVGDNGFGDKWTEKWDELYERNGLTQKWASKLGRKDRTQDDWHEQWGEKRAPPDEHDPNGRFLECWAEKTGSNGYGERWHDMWSEHLDPMSGAGKKMCNKWRVNADRSERIERSGEEWDGKGWYQKGGETLINGNKVDGWHDRAG